MLKRCQGCEKDLVLLVKDCSLSHSLSLSVCLLRLFIWRECNEKGAVVTMASQQPVLVSFFYSSIEKEEKSIV